MNLKYNPPFWLGTAPFCNPRPEDCRQTPGYEDSGERDIAGDGSRCWSGQKIKCVFKDENLKQDGLMLNQGANTAEVAFEGTWVGEAPFCAGTQCDLYKQGFIPVRSGKCGNGSCCITGLKWFGRKPTNDEERKTILEKVAECYKNEPDDTTLGFVNKIKDMITSKN